ncbi:MAG: DMT family transporter, partial [Actinomycetota bacterium]|nr:DMT family transporter [Actinomycetota bacterium]
MPYLSDRHRVRAAVLALFVTFLWSTSWVLIRIGLDDEELPPVVFAGLRYALASIVLIVWIATGPDRQAVWSLDRAQVRHLVVLGVVMYALTQGAQFVAIDAQPAATTSLLLASTPLMVMLLSMIALGEPASPRQRIGGVLIVAGSGTFFAGDLGVTTVGLVAALVGLGANTASSLLGRSINRAALITPKLITAASMTIGAVLLVTVGVATSGLPSIGARAWLIIGWLAIVNTAVAFTLWNRALRHLTATESAAINTTMVVQIPILGWVFLDEPLGWPEMTGILLVSVGVGACQGIRMSGATIDDSNPASSRGRDGPRAGEKARCARAAQHRTT